MVQTYNNRTLFYIEACRSSNTTFRKRAKTDAWFNGRSFGKANAAMSSVSSWGLVALCCRAKQEPSHTWQHVTGLGREHLCSASKYRLLHCGCRDTPGELVQEPTGKRGGLDVPPVQF